MINLLAREGSSRRGNGPSTIKMRGGNGPSTNKTPREGSSRGGNGPSIKEAIREGRFEGEGTAPPIKFLLLILCLLCSYQAYAITQVETDNIIKTIDERQRNSGDYKSLVYIEETQKDKPSKNLVALVYRRDADDKWMIIFSQPKSEAGKGYLRIDKNILLYEPTLGKWERSTERASIGGTGSQRSDFDDSNLATEFTAVSIGDEKLGKFPVHHLKLTVKPNVDVAYPILQLWVDQKSGNILKRQEFTDSNPNKLMRTIYYPKWNKLFSKSKKADVYVPEQIRIFDEVEKANSTVVAIKEVNLDPLDANIFTKAWIEKQSR